MAEPSVVGEADTPEAAEAAKAFASGVSPNPEPAPEAVADEPKVEEETPPVEGVDNQTPPPVPEPKAP